MNYEHKNTLENPLWLRQRWLWKSVLGQTDVIFMKASSVAKTYIRICISQRLKCLVSQTCTLLVSLLIYNITSPAYNSTSSWECRNYNSFIYFTHLQLYILSESLCMTKVWWVNTFIHMSWIRLNHWDFWIMVYFKLIWETDESMMLWD